MIITSCKKKKKTNKQTNYLDIATIFFGKLRPITPREISIYTLFFPSKAGPAEGSQMVANGYPENKGTVGVSGVMPESKRGAIWETFFTSLCASFEKDLRWKDGLSLHEKAR
jgi:hypothetical protein